MKWHLLYFVALLLVILSCTASASGTWSMAAIYQPQSGSFSSLQSTLELTANLGDTGVASKTVFSLMGLESQVFTGTATIDLWEFYSELSFTPSAVGFDHWTNTVSLALGSVELQSTFYLSYINTSTYLSFAMSGVVSNVNISITTELTTTSLCFSRTEISLSGLTFACIENLNARLRISKSGFEYAKFTFVNTPFKALPGLKVDAKLRFTLTRKLLNLSLEWGEVQQLLPCVKLYTALGEQTSSTVGVGINRLQIYAFEVNYSFGEVSFHSLSVLNPAYTTSLLGITKSGYWELMEISGSEDLCCGESLDWSAAIYFSSKSERLFDWAETVFSLKVPFSKRISMGVSIDVTEAGLEQIKTDVRTSW